MFGTKHEVAKILSLGNPDSVKHYHKRGSVIHRPSLPILLDDEDV
jgi:hypothetical protein